MSKKDARPLDSSLKTLNNDGTSLMETPRDSSMVVALILPLRRGYVGALIFTKNQAREGGPLDLRDGYD